MELQINQQAYNKLRAYVEECPEEISGYGKIEYFDGIPRVTDLVIFEQTVSAAHSDIDDNALGKFIYEMTKKEEDLSVWNLWWHSHANMDAFFSQTDTDTIDRSVEHQNLFSLVTNKDGKVVIRYDVYDPIRLSLKDKWELKVVYEEDAAIREEIKKEIAEKVSSFRSTIVSSPYAYGHTGYIPNKHGYVPNKSNQAGYRYNQDHDKVWDPELQSFVPITDVDAAIEDSYNEAFEKKQGSIEEGNPETYNKFIGDQYKDEDLKDAICWDIDSDGYYWILKPNGIWVWLTDEDFTATMESSLPYRRMGSAEDLLIGKDKKKSSTPKKEAVKKK